MVMLEREVMGTEPVQAVSPAETKPEPHPSVVAARDSKRSGCQGVGRNVAATEAGGGLHVQLADGSIEAASRLCPWCVTSAEG